MKKIGEIKGVPVVEGNKNEVTKNQLHYEETGGGIQLSKRGNDNKLNSVTGSSSSGDGGVKEYYYKINSSNEYSPFVAEMVAHIVPNPIYILHDGISIESSNSAGVINEIISFYNTVAFRYKDIDTLSLHPTNGKIIKITQGNLDIRTTYFMINFADPDADINDALQKIHSVCEEITKEEYESMITYKP